MATNYLDVALGAVFTLSAAATVGIVDVSLGGWSFGDELLSLPFGSLSVAVTVSLAMLAGAWLLNDPNLSRAPDEQKVLIALTVATVAGSAFAPATVIDPVRDSVALSILAVGVQAGGYWAVAHEC